MFQSQSSQRHEVARAQVLVLTLAALSLFAASACNSSNSPSASSGQPHLDQNTAVTAPESEPLTQPDHGDHHDDLPLPGFPGGPGKKEGGKKGPWGEDFEHRAAETLSPECLEAKHNLEALYAPIEQCVQDSDCAYMGGDFLPALPEAASITIDSCRWTRDLAVGNAGASTSYQLDLQLARESVEQICGTSLQRSDCSAPITFNPQGQPAPVCVENRCLIHPDVAL